MSRAVIPFMTKGDYIITFEALPEDISMRRHYIKVCGWTEKEYRKLVKTNPAWFCAKISAWYDGQEVGTAYLGCCCYDSEEQFWRSSDYIPQLVDEAIKEAQICVAKKGLI